MVALPVSTPTKKRASKVQGAHVESVRQWRALDRAERDAGLTSHTLTRRLAIAQCQLCLIYVGSGYYESSLYVYPVEQQTLNIGDGPPQYIESGRLVVCGSCARHHARQLPESLCVYNADQETEISVSVLRSRLSARLQEIYARLDAKSTQYPASFPASLSISPNTIQPKNTTNGSLISLYEYRQKHTSPFLTFPVSSLPSTSSTSTPTPSSTHCSLATTTPQSTTTSVKLSSSFLQELVQRQQQGQGQKQKQEQERCVRAI